MALTYSFGAVQVRPDERKVLVDGQPANLGARAFDVLMALIERRDRVVTKNELLDIAWNGLVVEENNLQVQVSTLRKLLGPHALATVPGRGYQFSMAVDDAVPPPVPLARARPAGNLPAACDELVGRGEDIDAVDRLIDVHRLVSIVGEGGIGKTRLAQEVARRRGNRHPDGVWWVDLAMVSANEKVAPAIAAGANVRLGPGNPTASLAEGLTARDTLIVLDNCEYVAGHVAAVVHAAMSAAASVRFLITSQELLRLPGECVHHLSPLEVPAVDAPLEDARRCAALHLLERRTRALDTRFHVGAENYAQAAELCRQLDGNALAIEMAAARLPVLGLGPLLDRLGDRLRLFRSANREAPARYQTLKATLDWSHSLLSADQQLALRRLSVFAASFSLEAAQRVVATGALDEWTALDSLAGLVDKSLVQVEPVDPPRYRLLETTRLYGLERLRESGERSAAEARHGDAMAKLAVEGEHAFQGEPEGSCIERCLPDYEDLQLAFDRAFARDDAEVAGAIAATLTRIDVGRGYYFMMQRRNAAILAMVPHASPLARARLWTCLASGRYGACPPLPRLVASQQEVSAWREIGDRRRIHEALARLAVIHATSGRDVEAEEVLADGRALADPAWPVPFKALCAFHAAVVSAYGPDVELFRSRAQELGRLARDAQSRRLMAVEFLELAEAMVRSRDYEAARDMGRRSLELIRPLGNPLGIGNVLSTYCNGLVAAGRLDDVPPVARESLALLLQCGVAGWIFDPVAWFAGLRGRLEESVRLLGFADAQYAAIQECRRPSDSNAEAEAMGIARKHLTPERIATCRGEGASLRKEQAHALALQVLEV